MLKDDSVLEKRPGEGAGLGLGSSEPAEGKEDICRVQAEDPHFSMARNAAGSTSGMWISSLFSASSP